MSEDQRCGVRGGATFESETFKPVKVITGSYVYLHQDGDQITIDRATAKAIATSILAALNEQPRTSESVAIANNLQEGGER